MAARSSDFYFNPNQQQLNSLLSTPEATNRHIDEAIRYLQNHKDVVADAEQFARRLTKINDSTLRESIDKLSRVVADIKASSKFAEKRALFERASQPKPDSKQPPKNLGLPSQRAASSSVSKPNVTKITSQLSDISLEPSALHSKSGKAESKGKPPKVFSKEASRSPIKQSTAINDKALDGFRRHLKELDINSPKLSTEITLLKLELEKFRSSINEEDYVLIETALDSFIMFYGYNPSESEQTLFDFLAEKNPLMKKNEESWRKTGRQAGCAEMRDVLKGDWSSLYELAQNIGSKFQQLKEKLPQIRFNNLPPQITSLPQFGDSFLRNLPNLLQNLASFSFNVILEGFKERWKALGKELEEASPGFLKFLIEKFPNLNPEIVFPNMLIDAQERYLSLALDDPSLSADELEDRIQQLLNNSFDKIYELFFLHQHVWLQIAFEAKWIKKIYDQALDKDKNQDSGTCLQNSLDRFRLLLDYPNSSSESIPMGSSEKGRAANAKVRLEFYQGKPVPTEELETRSVQRLSLRLSGKISIENKPNIYQSLSDEIDRLSQGGQNIQFILCLYGDINHAFNIQIDQQRGIYRILDDNNGIVQFRNLADFKSALFGVNGSVGYLRAFYPDTTKVAIQFYQPL